GLNTDSTVSRGYVSMTGGSDPYVLLVILYLYLLSR
ncbi:unnamed protein product, partial [Brassica oleracea]